MHSLPIPKPGGLIARMLKQKAQQEQQATDASAKLNQVPDVVDVSAWYEKHIELLNELLYLQVKVVAGTVDQNNAKLIQRIGETHAALREHTGVIAGDAIPKVLARDGKSSIPYESLAEARAKVKVLTAELSHVREELAEVKALDRHPQVRGTSERGK
ncbi:hypothetical protein [Ottowia thiooxydans]|uniref:hypothetical protein n=1 Tax=Ottowia thiooxydans TaxID=219182 RepID=UPI00040AF671|nr:hypothetical protein [Ottowia thiooxydans]